MFWESLGLEHICKCNVTEAIRGAWPAVRVSQVAGGKKSTVRFRALKFRRMSQENFWAWMFEANYV
jgi:hypothetical protein